jgi:heterodisulfide reductase subunit C
VGQDVTKEADQQLDLSTYNFALCYQCAKCSAGCPIAEAMDYLPHQILKMVQLDLMQEVLRSSTIWLCAGCQTCAVRCPMQIDLVQVMGGLKERAIAESVPAAERRIAAFNETFLADVQKKGRLDELRQLLAYKLKTRDLLSDIGVGARMFIKGRLTLKHVRVEDMEQVERLFDRYKSPKTRAMSNVEDEHTS